VLGILCGIIGTLQATEAIKLLLGKGDVLAGRLVTYDSLKMKFRELKLRRDPGCPVCGEKPTITTYIDYEGFCAIG
jgi:molybdopterin/thiamine biosynthesis adenylyltransferase